MARFGQLHTCPPTSHVVAAAALRLLKTGPSIVSLSSSDTFSTTLLPFSRGAGVGEALTIAKGTAAMGPEGVGEGMAWLVGGAEGAETPASAAAS